MGKETFDDPLEAEASRPLTAREREQVDMVVDLLNAGKSVPIELESIEEVVLAVHGTCSRIGGKLFGNGNESDEGKK